MRPWMGCLVLLAPFVVGASIAAEPHAVGDTVAPMRFETQFGDTVAMDASTRLVLVTHDMDAGSIAKAVLAEHTAETLAVRGAVYVADVSKMPGFVSRMIAIPRMRRRPYPVLLDRDGETSRLFPTVPAAVAAIWLEDGRVTRIEQLTTEAELRETLGAAPRAP